MSFFAFLCCNYDLWIVKIRYLFVYMWSVPVLFENASFFLPHLNEDLHVSSASQKILTSTLILAENYEGEKSERKWTFFKKNSGLKKNFWSSFDVLYIYFFLYFPSFCINMDNNRSCNIYRNIDLLNRFL